MIDFFQDNLVFPLRWTSIDVPNQYFMKLNDSDRWALLYNNKAYEFYIEVSSDIDPDGFPIVILKRVGTIYFICLTQSNSFGGFDLREITISYYSGFWTVKDVENKGNN